MTMNDKIPTNGFFVNIDNGECDEEPYFLNDGMSVKSRDFNRFNTKKTNHQHKNRITSEVLERNRKQYAEYGINIYIFRKLNSLLNCLSGHINDSQRENLFNYITMKKPRSINELYKLVFDYIVEFDLPITTRELIDIISIDLNSDRFKLYDQIRNITTLRKYHWLILRKLSQIPYLTEGEKTRFYMGVKQYYDLIRFQLSIACDPTHLIGFLIYETINTFCPAIPKKYRTHKFLETSHFFKLGHREQLDKIKSLDLDKEFKFKLNF